MVVLLLPIALGGRAASAGLGPTRVMTSHVKEAALLPANAQV